MAVRIDGEIVFPGHDPDDHDAALGAEVALEQARDAVIAAAQEAYRSLPSGGTRNWLGETLAAYGSALAAYHEAYRVAYATPTAATGEGG